MKSYMSHYFYCSIRPDKLLYDAERDLLAIAQFLIFTRCNCHPSFFIFFCLLPYMVNKDVYIIQNSYHAAVSSASKLVPQRSTSCRRVVAIHGVA